MQKCRRHLRYNTYWMESTTTDLTALTPAQIDERWQKALLPAARAESALQACRNQIKRQEQQEANGVLPVYAQRSLADARAREPGLVEAVREAYKAEKPFQAEWARRSGWSRYYLVSGGHLHFYSCRTLTPGKTLVGLLYEASGMTAEQVVDRYDVTACTVCFPDAPVARKLSAEEQGLCSYSGKPAVDFLPDRFKDQWWRFAVAPSAKCPCGYKGAITKGGKFRKHKPGGNG